MFGPNTHIASIIRNLTRISVDSTDIMSTHYFASISTIEGISLAMSIVMFYNIQGKVITEKKKTEKFKLSYGKAFTQADTLKSQFNINHSFL